MVAGLILTIGLVAVLGVFSLAMAGTQTSQQDLLAKQLATAAMESIFTARDTSQLQWAQIQNVGSGTVPDGIFVTGSQAILQPGPDGIIGTADDGPAQVLKLPGKDGIVGSADDQTLGLTNYTRTISIGTVTGTTTLRTVTITITYAVPQLKTTKNYVMTAYISQYR
jgi:hypothetical protein